MNRLLNIFIVLSIPMLAFVLPASAQMGAKTMHGKSGISQYREMAHGMEYHQDHMRGKHVGHGRGHLFGSHWKETLTEEQKVAADKLHLTLKRSVNVRKAQLRVKKIELNNMVASDTPDIMAIYLKIDEILDMKGDIMKRKYDHMVEMRGILTPEQRVSFDMKLVEMAGRKKGHRRH